MKRFAASLLLSMAATISANPSDAGDIYFGGNLTPLAGSTGTLQILFNTLPDNYTFKNGGIDLELISSTPGVIEFTGGTIIDNDGRWAAAAVQEVSADHIGRTVGFSVQTPGLPSGPDVVFAEVNYNVIGSVGSSTTLTLGVNLDGLYDGSINFPNGLDVSGSFTIHDGLITVVPEPACLTMVGLAAVTLLNRRRR